MREPYFYSTADDDEDDGAPFDWSVGAHQSVQRVVPASPSATPGAVSVRPPAGAFHAALDLSPDPDEDEDAESLEDLFGDTAAVLGLELDEEGGRGALHVGDDDDEDEGDVRDDELRIVELDEVWDAELLDDADPDDAWSWESEAGLELPDFDDDATLVPSNAAPAGLSDTAWREGWIELFVADHGPLPRDIRALLTQLVMDSGSPAATLRPVGELLAGGASWAELRGCIELREAWQEHGELGTAVVAPHVGDVHHQWVELPLAWSEALHVLRAFSAQPTTDEAILILEALHRQWVSYWYPAHRVDAWPFEHEWNWAWCTFSRFAVDMLEAHCDPFYWAELA